MKNIQVVDNIVRQTEGLFSEFYKDDATAFIFTADHGMSKIGNHGDGGKVFAAHSSTTLSLTAFIPLYMSRSR